MNHIPIDLVGCNVRITDRTDRFHRDYKLTKAEIITAFFYALLAVIAIII